MAVNELILKPVIDRESLKKTSNSMRTAYQNAGMLAARKVADYSQQKLTSAYKLAARAGGSAMHSIFQVGFSSILGQIQKTVQDTDAQIERTTERAARIGGDLVNRAAAFGVAPEKLRALEITAGGVGIEGEMIDKLLTQFNASLINNPAMINFKNQANNDDLLSSFVTFLKQAQAAPEKKRLEMFTAAGVGADDVTKTKMLTTTVAGLENWKQMFDTLGITQEQMKRSIENATKNNALIDLANAKMAVSEMKQAGVTSQSDVQKIQDLRMKEQAAGFAGESTLDQQLRVRESILEVETKLQKTIIDVVFHLSKIVDMFNKEGLGAALSYAIDPISKAINEGLDKLGEKIEVVVKDATKGIADGFTIGNLFSTVKSNEDNSKSGITQTAWLNGFRGIGSGGL